LSLAKYLSKKDAVDLLEINYKAMHNTDENEFKNLILQLHDLIDFEFAICGRGNPKKDLLPKKSSYTVVNIKYPEDYLRRYLSKRYHLIDPMIRKVLQAREVQSWRDVRKQCPSGTNESGYVEAEEFGLLDGFTYGVCNLFDGDLSCFFFAGKRVENNDRTKIIIKYAVPHLSRALDLLITQKKTKDRYSLTPREIEVLNWLKDGKTSWEISKILNISERCTNFHADNIRCKLGAVNRTQAIAIAVGEKLIAL